MPLGERGPYELLDKRGAPLLKRRYSTAIGLSNVKMVADSTDLLLIITSTSNELLRNVNIYDLE